MKTFDTPTLTAYQNVPSDGIAKRDFVSIYAWQFDGTPASFFLWDGLDTVDANVVDPDTGSSAARTFVGDGTLIKVGKIVSTADLSIRRTEIVVSPLIPYVRDMLFGHRIRKAGLQIHRATLDVDTKLPVSDARLLFVGFIDGSPDEREASGGAAELAVRAVSDTRLLTVTNPAIFDDTTVKARVETDTFGLYASSQQYWNIVVGASE